MNKLVFANLLRRPLRSVISILAVAIEVIMILSIVAIFMGMLNDQKERTNGIGADLILWPSNASFMNGVGGAPLPAKDADALRRLPHIADVSPVIQHLVTSGRVEIIWGIDYPSFEALRPFVYVQGGPFQQPYDVIVDDRFASAQNPATRKPYAVGDMIAIMDHPFRICGIVEHGKGGGKMVPIDTIGQMLGAEDHASNFYIKCDNPSNMEAVIAEIHSTKGLESFPVQTVTQWLETMTPERLPGFNIALDAVTVIAVIIGFLVIFQSMYTAVLERTREIGILKSMGASKMTIVGVVLRECAVLAVAGVALGIACVFGVQWVYLHLFPSQHFEITAEWILRASVIAFTGSICGALYPAWMAARKDPIDALAYE